MNMICDASWDGCPATPESASPFAEGVVKSPVVTKRRLLTGLHSGSSQLIDV